MKKSVRTIITGTVCAAVAIAGVGAGTLLTSAKIAEKKSIGFEAAYNVALKSAGVESNKVTEKDNDLELKNGKYVFDIEFDADGKEYEYQIDSKTGEVISSKVEPKAENPVRVKETSSAITEKTTEVSKAKKEKSTSINSEKAVNIALADAGLKNSEVSGLRSEFDKEDNCFEIEFRTSDKEYDYEISAVSGKIVDKEIESLKPVVSRPETTAPAKPQAEVTLDSAKAAAINNAGLKAGDVTFTKAKLDKEDNCFEIEFRTSDKEYDYEISAVSGKIVDKEIESLKPVVSRPETTAPAKPQAEVTLDSAKAAAINNAGLKAGDVTFTKAKLDKEDNCFEIEFRTSDKEYDYEISAASGKIVDKEVENLKPVANKEKAPSPEKKTTDISLDEAKKIALEKAGLSAENVRIIKAKLENEDGKRVYEIEFVSGIYEYEAEINSSDGSIIDFSKEIDD